MSEIEGLPFEDSFINGEKKIDNGLGLFIRQKRLYHGSATLDIEIFNRAEEYTVGSGIYFTSEAKAARGYAILRARSKEGSSPVVYEVDVKNIKLLDLTNDENVKKVLEGFKLILIKKLQDPSLNWVVQNTLLLALDNINSIRIGAGNLKQAVSNCGNLFTEYCQTLGYEGLVTFEGGEGDIGKHDTYLIFDPEKVEIKQ